MDMNKQSPEAISESKVNRKIVWLGVAFAFAAGAFVKGEVDKRQSSDVCSLTVTDTSDGTRITTNGSETSCAPFLAVLRAGIQNGSDDAPDEQDGEATHDQSEPCDPASAPAGASQ